MAIPTTPTTRRTRSNNEIDCVFTFRPSHEHENQRNGRRPADPPPIVAVQLPTHKMASPSRKGECKVARGGAVASSSEVFGAWRCHPVDASYVSTFGTLRLPRDSGGNQMRARTSSYVIGDQIFCVLAGDVRAVRWSASIRYRPRVAWLVRLEYRVHAVLGRLKAVLRTSPP